MSAIVQTTPPRKRYPGHGRTSLTEQQLTQARMMLRSKQQYREIAKVMGVNRDTLRRALDPIWRAKRNEQIAMAYQTFKSRPFPDTPDQVRFNPQRSLKETVPAELLTERDYRVNLPKTTTATICGDPPPGYSALDRKLLPVA